MEKKPIRNCDSHNEREKFYVPIKSLEAQNRTNAESFRELLRFTYEHMKNSNHQK